jgi:sialate O-acetylesterase
LISDHAVLQRDQPIRLWGWADAGEEIQATLGEQSGKTTAAADGRWVLELPAMKAGGPYQLIVTGKNRLVLDDILIGDVWICSGQSNMEMVVVKVRNEVEEKALANYPQIRLMTIPKSEKQTPVEETPADWFVCSPKTVGYFSAVAYFFGREIHQQEKVPVGLICSAVGGTRIEDWTAGPGVKLVPALAGRDKPNNGILYNGMIAPLTPFRIKGFIWYQGEGNVGDGMIYRDRMEALILGWRKAWQDEKLPFYYVQVAPLNWGGKPVDALPLLWEAQTAAMSIPYTGMAVTNDVANTGDAHPKNKQPVGKRLALWALSKTYGMPNLTVSGPIYRSSTIEGNKIRIEFDYATGLKTRNGRGNGKEAAPNWFTIAGADRKFLPAEAVIKGEAIFVSNPDIAEPVAVRFGWHQIAEPNLMNGAELPAPSFRTDNW